MHGSWTGRINSQILRGKELQKEGNVVPILALYPTKKIPKLGATKEICGLPNAVWPKQSIVKCIRTYSFIWHNLHIMENGL